MKWQFFLLLFELENSVNSFGVGNALAYSYYNLSTVCFSIKYVWWTLDHALIIRISSNQEGHCEACFEHVLVCWRTFPSVIVYLPLKIWHVEKAELVFCFYKRWSSIIFFCYLYLFEYWIAPLILYRIKHPKVLSHTRCNICCCV